MKTSNVAGDIEQSGDHQVQDPPAVVGDPPAPPAVFGKVSLNGGQSRFVVYGDGAEISRHTAEREAIESAVNSLRAYVKVHYVHEYQVDVSG